MAAKRKFSPALLYLPALAALISSLALISASGGSPMGLLWCWLVAAAGVLGPGLVLVWRAGDKIPAPLRGPAAIAFGLAVFACGTIAGSLTGNVWVPRAITLLFALGLVAGAVRRREKTVLPPGGGVLFLALLVLASTAGAVQFAHPTAVGQICPNQDFFWNLGNAESFLLGFPPQDLRFSGITLTYHYLTELFAAGISMLSGLPVYDVLAFYQTPLLLALTVYLLWKIGTVILGSAAKRRRLLAATFLFGCASLYKVWPDGQSRFWNTAIRHILTNINGQATATVFLALFTLFFWQLDQKGFDRWMTGAALVSFAGLSFAKGPVAGILAIAVVCGCVARALQRGCNRRAPLLLFAAAVGGGFGLLYLFYFSAGAASSMVFDPAGTLGKSYFSNLIALVTAKNPTAGRLSLPLFMLLQTFCMAPATFLLYLRGVFADLARLKNLSASRLVWNAAAVGGFAAFFLFDHVSMSQMYFAYAGLFFLNLLAVDRLDQIAVWLRPLGRWGGRFARCALGLLAAVGLATGLLMIGTLAAQGAQILTDPAGAVAEAQEAQGKQPLTADEEQGMRWLAQQAEPGELFATNRIHTGAAAEGLSNVYSGLSGVPAYMESFKYAVSNMGVASEEVTARLAVIEQIFDPATPAGEVAALCEEKGIRWLVYSPVFSGSEEQFAAFEKVYDSPGMRIYRVG